MKRNACYLAALTTGLLFPPLAFTQDDENLVLEEVIVTAEKRETSLQETAIAVNVFSGEYPENLNIQDPQALIVRDPSMSFSRAGGEGQVFIRGVGSNL